MYNAPKTKYLQMNNGARIAYRKDEALASQDALPEIVFLGGYASNMEGSKAEAYSHWAREKGYGFLRFDYRGHGRSDGEFLDFGIGDWYEDACFAIDALTKGPIVLIGSSMGGWLATKYASEFPQKLKALIGIAAAPDFTEDLFWASFSDEEKATIEAGEMVERPSGYEDPYRISPRLIEQGRDMLVLKTPLELQMPVRLFQGLEDKSVSSETAIRLASHAVCDDLVLSLVKNSDHSFSTPENIELMLSTIAQFIKI